MKVAVPVDAGRTRDTCGGFPVEILKEDHCPSTPSLAGYQHLGIP